MNLSDIKDPSLRQTIERQLAGDTVPVRGRPVVAPPQKLSLVAKPSKAEEKLNKTERAYLALLRARRVPQLGVQRVTLRLADDTRYTPDFDHLGPNGELVLAEVKGWMRDDARVKIKVAAAQFPHFTFVLVKREKGGGWSEEPVAP